MLAAVKSPLADRKPDAIGSEMLEAGSDRSPARAREDYVKAIHQLGGTAPVKAADVARYLGVSAVSVSKAKKLLERDGFLERSDRPTDRLVLSPRGRSLAVAIIRRHRLLETFFRSTLAMPLERVHMEAERVEHVISDDVAERLAAHLGHPATDPHGHAIPYTDDAPPAPRLPTLADVTAGCEVRVRTLEDRDPEAVRTLAAHGVLPGYVATVVRADGAGVELRSFDAGCVLSREHAAKVRVEVARA